MHLIEIKQVAPVFSAFAGEFEQYTFVDSHEISSSVVIPQAAKVAAFGIFPRSILLLQTLFGKRVRNFRHNKKEIAIFNIAVSLFIHSAATLISF